MRATSIILLDHQADLDGAMTLDELATATLRYVREAFGDPVEQSIEIEWVASEALGAVVPFDLRGPAPSYAAARAEFLEDCEFSAATFAIEPLEAARPPVVQRVLADLATWTGDTETAEMAETLAEKLEACANWLRTGLPGVASSCEFNLYSGRNYDLRYSWSREDAALGAWVLVKLNKRF